MADQREPAVGPCPFCQAEGKLFVVPHPTRPPKFWPYANHTSDCPLRPGEFHDNEEVAIAAWQSRHSAIAAAEERLREHRATFERVTRLADTLASNAPADAEVRGHIERAYAAIRSLDTGGGG